MPQHARTWARWLTRKVGVILPQPRPFPESVAVGGNGPGDRLRRSSQSSTFISGATALTSPSATSLPPPRSIWQRRTRGSASPSRGPGNGILRAETGGLFQAQNAGEQSEFGSQTTLRLTNPPELRGFLSTRKPPRFVGTAWWRTQSRQTGLRDRVRLGNREKHTAMAVNAFFWGPKRRGLRFSERLNTRPYNVLAEHEPNRAKQNKRQNKRQSNRQTANDSQRFFSAFERLNTRLYNALASVAGQRLQERPRRVRVRSSAARRTSNNILNY